MKLVRKQKEDFVFLIEQEERPLLLSLLKHYPLMPAAYQPLSKLADAKTNEANQRLLDEALAEQRQENRRQLEALLAAPRRFRKVEAGWHLTLSSDDLEWLLQVLNDLRVGSWVILGAPEKDALDFELNQEMVAHAWTMEIAGFFQSQLLLALHGGAN